MAQPSKTPIDPGLVQLASGLIVPDAQSAYFGPGQPLAPLAPPDQRWTVQGRAFDYPFAYNTRMQPRDDAAPVSFAQLRALADSCDILRLVIQTRKYQMAALEWAVVPRDEDKQADDRCAEVEAFLRCPDGENTWHDWLQILLEDRFVLDACTIYPWLRNNGKPYRLEIMDGAQIARVLDVRGRTPAPPAPAYRHLIKGMNAVFYTADELIYRPANKRSHTQYGQSEVEQIILTVNAAIRKQVAQLQRFTDGSVPDLLFQVPADWNMAQIKEFNDWWQARLSGDTAEQRKAQFVPNGMVPVDTKQAVLKDEYDEWLARVVCYAFSVSPQAFIKQLNRSTAETAQAMAKEEGLFPVMNWVRELKNSIIEKYFLWPDLQFKWKLANELSTKEQSAVDDVNLKNGSVTLDEVRLRRGEDPYGINFPMVLTASGFTAVPLTAEEAKPQPPAPAPALGDGKSPQPETASRGTAPEPDATAKLAKRDKVGDPFGAIRKQFIAKFKKLQASIVAQLDEDTPVEELDIGFGDLAESLFKSVLASVQSGVAVAEDQITAAGRDVVAPLDTDLQAWASERVGDLIGKRLIDGEWKDNPNPAYPIADSTREMIRADIVEGLEQGKSNQEIAKDLKESYAFSDQRAEVIARTETATAQSQGALESYRANGVEFKKWSTAPGCCDECDTLDGQVVGIDEDFESDDGETGDAPPWHPQCRCAVQPVFEAPEEE